MPGVAALAGAAGIGSLTSMASGFPIGAAGGAGYGFGIRYGFEKLFPAFQSGVGQAINLVSGDFKELMDKLNMMIDDGLFQGRGKDGQTTKLYEYEDPNVVSYEEKPPPVIEDITPKITKDTEPPLSEAKYKWTIKYNQIRGAKKIPKTRTYNRTRTEYTELISDLDQKIQLGGTSRDGLKSLMNLVYALRVKFHSVFGKWV